MVAAVGWRRGLVWPVALVLTGGVVVVMHQGSTSQASPFVCRYTSCAVGLCHPYEAEVEGGTS